MHTYSYIPTPHVSRPSHCSYSAGYPADPLSLDLLSSEGLQQEDVSKLKARLVEDARQYAQRKSVCVFDLVDVAQVSQLSQRPSSLMIRQGMSSGWL